MPYTDDSPQARAGKIGGERSERREERVRVETVQGMDAELAELQAADVRDGWR